MTTTHPIRLIALDLDGTLLDSQHRLSARNERALKQAMAWGAQVILATGKTRAAAAGTIARLGLTTPGVYLQGLVIYNGDGTIRHQQTLAVEVARQVIDFAEREGHPLLVYSGARILTAARNAWTDDVARYHEPLPEAVGSLHGVVDGVPINKLILLAEAAQVPAMRARLSARLDGQATLVQALPDMLEVLPPGASKGAGVRWLLDELGIAPRHVLAIGDAENDIEMLRLAGIGVAVGNAPPQVRQAADFVVASNDEDGVAEAVERFVLSAS